MGDTTKQNNQPRDGDGGLSVWVAEMEEKPGEDYMTTQSAKSLHRANLK
jgi:hypothetical protein